MIILRVASLQLPAKYPQLPALLIGQNGTLRWRIQLTCPFLVKHTHTLNPFHYLWLHMTALYNTLHHLLFSPQRAEALTAEAQRAVPERDYEAMLTYLLTQESLTPEEVNSHAIDMMTGGVETVSEVRGSRRRGGWRVEFMVDGSRVVWDDVKEREGRGGEGRGGEGRGGEGRGGEGRGGEGKGGEGRGGGWGEGRGGGG